MSPRHTLAGLALLAGLSLAGAAAAAANGQQVFLESCAACHQPTGVGRPPTFPALKGDKFVIGPKTPVVATVLNGRGGMPAWKSELTDDEVAAVATYIRTSWGNKAPAVTTAEAAAVRTNAKAPLPTKGGLQAH
jgi:mono/diheme cytochrome c family protein